MARPRPKYLNLFQIRLPVPGVISIMHRASGAALFLFIPLLLALFELSLESPQTFMRFKELFSHWALKLILIGLIWGYLHHLLRRHTPPCTRSSLWNRVAGRARDQLGGAGGRDHPDRRHRGDAMVKREVVGAHYGLRDWLAQRVTAVIMVVYTAVILSALAGLPQMDYSQWKVLWQLPVMKLRDGLVRRQPAVPCLGRHAQYFHGLHQIPGAALDALRAHHRGAAVVRVLVDTDTLGIVNGIAGTYL